MGYIFRAFYVPMDRLQTAAGVDEVLYLFATMMRLRLMKSKDLAPDYLAVVFDVAAPTFRDKLFDLFTKRSGRPCPMNWRSRFLCAPVLRSDASANHRTCPDMKRTT